MSVHSRLAFLSLTLLFVVSTGSAGAVAGASMVDVHGYTGCVLLENPQVRVVLEPNCGGRVLEYSLKGVNAIHVDPAQDGLTADTATKIPDPTAEGATSAQK